MPNRLTVIATRTGDTGTTALGDGSRVGKDDIRVAALGDVDELNSHIGLWRAQPLPAEMDSLLEQVQHDLFDLGAQLCLPGHVAVGETHVQRLDAALAQYNGQLGPLKEFILPAGGQAACQAHVTRAVCRRAERALVALHRVSPLAPACLQYLNRLSDLCFVLARACNEHEGRGQAYWRR